MKKIIFILMTLFLASQTKTQTLNETVDWINSTLGDNRPIFYDDLFNVLESSLIEIKRDGNFTKITYKYKSLMPSVITKIVEETGNLKDLSLNSLEIQKLSDGSYILVAKCFNNKQCIWQINYSTENNEKKDIEFTSEKYIISLAHFENNELELAKRSKKAIQHLMTLLGAKNEAF